MPPNAPSRPAQTWRGSARRPGWPRSGGRCVARDSPGLGCPRLPRAGARRKPRSGPSRADCGRRWGPSDRRRVRALVSGQRARWAQVGRRPAVGGWACGPHRFTAAGARASRFGPCSLAPVASAMHFVARLDSRMAGCPFATQCPPPVRSRLLDRIAGAPCPGRPEGKGAALWLWAARAEGGR